MSEVCVVVPVRDGAAALGRCLDALGRQVGADARVVVVDNGSTDGSADLARAHPAVDDVVVERRRGSYAARNAALAEQDSPAYAFTDADCVPEPDWLAQGLTVLAGASLVAGAVRMSVGPRPRAVEVWDAAHYLDQERFVSEGFAATANLFVRREVFDAVGPFDARLLSSGDLELCRRATAAGFALAYAADAAVGHAARSSVAELWRVQRRLGAGWRVLAARGEHPRACRDPFMRPRFGHVAATARERGLPVRPAPLAAVHGLVVAGRWTGRIVGR